MWQSVGGLRVEVGALGDVINGAGGGARARAIGKGVWGKRERKGTSTRKGSQERTPV